MSTRPGKSSRFDARDGRGVKAAAAVPPGNKGMLEDHGRGATEPAEIPARGWKDILLRVYTNVLRHRVMALAAGMTYYSILAIFPAIAALVAIYGLFSDPSAIARHLDQLGGLDFSRAEPSILPATSSRAFPPRGRKPWV
jgi:hypothetical protein